MPVLYRVDIENSAGSTVAIFEDFRSLSFTQRISAKGEYQLTLSGFDSRIGEIQDDSIVRIWFQDNTFGIDWLNIFNGIHKTFSDSLSPNGQQIYTSYGPAMEELLEKTWILYPTDSAQANKSGAASSVMLSYVYENVGAGGTASRDYPAQNLVTLAADPILGGTWSGSKARKNLMATIREISDFTRENNAAITDKVDFRVTYLGGFQFQFEVGQLGIDRTTEGLHIGSGGLNAAGNAPLIFSAQLGNIQSERLSRSRYNEANVVVALGQGYGSDRRVEVATDTDSLAVSGIAQRESVVNSVQSDTAADLVGSAKAKLKELVSKEQFNFNPRRGAQVLYRDYFLADFVTAQSNRSGVRVNKQLRSISTSVNPDGEEVDEIRMEFEDI